MVCGASSYCVAMLDLAGREHLMKETMMNDNRFDDLTRALVTTTSRRQFLKTLAGSAAGCLLVACGSGEAAARVVVVIMSQPSFVPLDDDAQPSHPSTHDHFKKLTMSQDAQQAAASVAIYGIPLQIIAYSNGSVAVYRNGVQQFFGSNASGVYMWVGGKAWGPSVPFNQQPPTPYSEFGVSGPTGAGTADAPWLLTVTLGVPGLDLSIEQTISYINGSDFISYEWIVRNLGGQTQSYTLFHAADLYLAGDDRGIGYYNPATNAIGGRNRIGDQFELFIPITPATAYQEAFYSTIWRAISSYDIPGPGFNYTTIPSYTDNGAGLQWSNQLLEPGQVKSIRDYVSFADIPIIPSLKPDPNRSIITAYPPEVLGNGQAAVEVTVTLLDNQGRPVPGKQVKVQSNRPEDMLTQSRTATDSTGTIKAFIRSTNVGIVTITAEDITDQIALANTTQTNFVAVPNTGFANYIRDQVEENKNHSKIVSDRVEEVADIGRKFKSDLTAHLVETTVGTVIDAISLKGAVLGFNSSLAAKGISHIATPGWKAAKNASWRFYTNGSRAERHFLKPLYDSLHNNGSLTLAKARPIFTAGSEYLGREFVLHVAPELAGKTTQEIFKRIMAETDPFAFYSNATKALAESYCDELNDPRDELLAALPGLQVTFAEELDYREDLAYRGYANRELAQRVRSQTMPLEEARAARQANEANWCNQWCPFLLKQGAVIGSTIAWDGPGYYLSNLAGESVLAVYDRWENGQNIRQDVQVFRDSFTFITGTTANLTIEEINQNTMNGLYLIKTKDMPILPKLTIGAINHYSVGECRDWFGLRFIEEASYTEISLINNTLDDTTIQAWATYQHKPGWFTDAVTLYREAPGITLAPGQSGKLRLTYLQNRYGASPIESSNLEISMVASTSTGTYLDYVPTTTYEAPQRIDQNGNAVSCRLASQATTWFNSSQSGDAATVGFPITIYVARVSGTDQIVITALVENSLTTALQAVISQPVPTGITVIDIGGGTIVGDRVTWSTVLGPGEPATFTLLLQSASASPSITLLGAQVIFTDPDSGRTASFSAPDQNIPSLVPIEVDAYVPETIGVGEELSIRILLHNRLSGQSATDTLHVSLLDFNDQLQSQAEKTLSLAADARQEINILLTAPSIPGTYLVVGRLTGAAAAPEMFSALVKVTSTTFLPLLLK
jgi:hypothetical protein